jgi:DNA invertase Pin-like site-specific DNA recombinase
MAIFGYGRVSTKDQQSETQRLELERAGYQVDYWFADEGVSGKIPSLQRPQFAKRLGQIAIERRWWYQSSIASATMLKTSAPRSR